MPNARALSNMLFTTEWLYFGGGVIRLYRAGSVDKKHTQLARLICFVKAGMCDWNLEEKGLEGELRVVGSGPDKLVCMGRW